MAKVVKKDKKVAVKTSTTKKVVGANLRPSRIAKHVKKLEKLKATGLKVENISFGVKVIVNNSPCELSGVILSESEHSITLHCQKHGSSKEIIRLIPQSDVIEVIGGQGMPSVVRYFGPKVLTELKAASVQSEGNTFTITDLTTGDTSTVVASDRVHVEIVGAAENAVASAKSEKTTKKFSKK